jgi:hypothetical protein
MVSAIVIYNRIYNEINNPNYVNKCIAKYFNNKWKIQLNDYLITLSNIIIQEEDSIFNEFYIKCVELIVSILQIDNREKEILFYYKKCADHLEKNKDNEMVCVYYNKIIDIYMKNNEHLEIANIYKNIAMIYETNYNIDSSIENFLKALFYYKLLNNTYEIENINYNLARQYIILSNYGVSISYLQSIIIQNSNYRIDKKWLNYILLYFLLKIIKVIEEGTINDLFKELQNNNQFFGFSGTEEYAFILNIISSIRNKDIEHFRIEIHRYTTNYLNKSPIEFICKTLFIEINKRFYKFL